MIAPRSLRVVANGQMHHALDWSPASFDAIAVLVHGYMDAAATFDLVAPLLADAGLRVLAPDMRGFGDGPRVPPGGYYHFPDYIADLRALLDHPEIGATPPVPILLVGHSMGGTIATLYAGANPARIAKVALLEGFGPPDNPFEAAPDRMVAWLEQTKDPRPARSFAATDAVRRLALNHPHVDSAILASRVPHLTRPAREPNMLTWAFDPLHRATSPMPFFARVYIEYAKRITCPVLAVSGGSTGYHTPDEAERLAAFPDLTAREISGAGHMMHWTKPRELSETLLTFWRGS